MLLAELNACLRFLGKCPLPTVHFLQPEYLFLICRSRAVITLLTLAKERNISLNVIRNPGNHDMPANGQQHKLHLSGPALLLHTVQQRR